MYNTRKGNGASVSSYGKPVQGAYSYGSQGAVPGTQPQAGTTTVPAQAQPPAPSAPHPMYSAPQGQQSGTTPYVHGSAAPQMQPTPPPHTQKPAEKNASRKKQFAGFISSKIFKVNAKDKVVDFSSKLSVAKVEDFANIHGCGGSDHAANSTIAVTICDFTKGKGENSVTASYNVDVEIMEVLYQAAMNARMGTFSNDASAELVAAVHTAIYELNRWGTAGSQQPVAVIPFQELVTTGTALGNAVKQKDASALNTASEQSLADLRRWSASSKQIPASGVPLREIFDIKTALEKAAAKQDKPLFVYSYEKNNPHQRDAQGLVPASKIYISYTPIRKNGEVVRYPWFIQIENFRAPLSTKASGASSHDASKAVQRKSVSINMSTDDFAKAMVAVKRYIRVWEMVTAIPIVRGGLRLLENIKEEKRNKEGEMNNYGYYKAG